jgi:cytochrome b561
MGLRNTPERWGAVAQSLHWGMALLILAMFALGLAAENWPLSPTKFELFFWHKSIGILLLALVLARIAWRLANPAPALPPDATALERRAALAAHGALYLLMVLVPLSGWVVNSAANFPFAVFGVIPLPPIAPAGKEVQALAETVHSTLVLMLAVLVAVHVAAALRHHLVKGNDVLTRMLPGRRTP